MSSTSIHDPTLTAAEIKEYEISKARWFKATIAVCVIYGGFALVLLLLAIFDARGRKILAEDLMSFTITFVGGMIFVIILLVIQIVTYKPKKLVNNIYDGDMCPDYWKLEATPTEVLNTITGHNKALMKYRCVPDPKVFAMNLKSTPNAQRFAPVLSNNDTNVYGHRYSSTSNTYTKSIPTGNTNLKSASQIMYNNQNNLRCDVVYPNLLASRDVANNADDPTQLRCSYASLCKMPWTAVCPKP
jgi:hypothetical protein